MIMENRLTPYTDYKPFHLTVDGEDVLCFRDGEQIAEYAMNFPKVPTTQLGKLCVAMFRGTERMPNASDNDYFGIQRYTDKGEEVWTLDFGKYEFLTYIAGFGLTKERQRALYLAEREHGTFKDKFGWNPQVVVEDEPTKNEQEQFILHEIEDIDDTERIKGFLND